MIEASYPAVYLSELAFSATTIDGVSTDRIGATNIDRLRSEPSVEAPAWTDANESDPGMTLVDLFSWVSEFTTYGGPRNLPGPLHRIAAEADSAGGLDDQPR
jgi:hypothetical protein